MTHSEPQDLDTALIPKLPIPPCLKKSYFVLSILRPCTKIRPWLYTSLLWSPSTPIYFTLQLTLEQHGSTYTRIFSNSKYYSSTWFKWAEFEDVKPQVLWNLGYSRAHCNSHTRSPPCCLSVNCILHAASTLQTGSVPPAQYPWLIFKFSA